MRESKNHGKVEKSEVSEAAAKTEKVDVKKLESEAAVGVEAAKFAAEVAEIAETGVESAESGEGFSEQKGDQKDDSAVKKSSQQAQQDLKVHIHTIVSSQKMQKQIAVAIRKEIRKEEQKVLLAYVGIRKYSPHRLAAMVAKIRNLKDLLSSLVDATKEILTGLYLKWVKREI
ncbi:MAG: hypothetical protein ABIE14_02475 [Patescibacteria group bacterium]